ncbi:uncharacterized protein TNCV_4788211 [Trichonephila clavipes]|nr:uncharacterized protein TNCV_4788211 [Trichonephila clavipes]
MDSNVVASDLINIFLSNMSSEKRHKSLSGATFDEVLHNGKEKLQTEKNDVAPPEIQRTEMTSSYSQTIITGKIFSEMHHLRSVVDLSKSVHLNHLPIGQQACRACMRRLGRKGIPIRNSH